MRYVAAYLLANLSGNEPDLKAIEKILSSVGIETDKDKANKVIAELKGKKIEDLIKEGSTKLATVSAAAPAAAPAAAAGKAAPAAAAAAKPAESKFHGMLWSKSVFIKVQVRRSFCTLSILIERVAFVAYLFLENSCRVKVASRALGVS